MISLRGDAHKFYLKLLNDKQNISQLTEMKEIAAIQSFYQGLHTEQLIQIRYWMEKEMNGSGVLPFLLSSLPWLLFIFSKQIQAWLLQGESHVLLWSFIFLYASFITISIVIHFRERSWASIHIKILEDLIYERKSTPMS